MESLMKRFLGLVFLLVLSTGLAASGADNASEELKALEGKWKTVAVSAGGMSFPKENVPEFTFTVTKDGKATGKSSREEYEAKITKRDSIPVSAAPVSSEGS